MLVVILPSSTIALDRSCASRLHCPLKGLTNSAVKRIFLKAFAPQYPVSDPALPKMCAEVASANAFSDVSIDFLKLPWVRCNSAFFDQFAQLLTVNQLS